MKKLVCEMCGSIDLIKQDGCFVCQFCGCKYTVEEAKKIMIEKNINIQGTVKIDNSEELKNLYQIARRAKNDNNCENAAKYYEMILIKDPTSWEASFYTIYFKAMECKIAEIQSAAISVSNCINTVLKLIKDNVVNREEQKDAYIEVSNKVMVIAGMLFNGAKNHYDGIDSNIKNNYKQKLVNDAFAAMECLYILGNSLDEMFGTDADANRLAVNAWKQGVAWHQTLIMHLTYKERNRKIVNNYKSKIKKYDSSYTPPKESTNGCYVATCVYGSYDCPQVWTLRRYRDDTLSSTWYGRAFIKLYYAISPTLVKWFGKTKWFKKMWKGTLNRMVEKLQSNGVESTYYDDKER